MNRKYLAAAIVIILGSAFFFLRPALAASGDVPAGVVRDNANSSVTAPANRRPGSTNDPLASAYQTAAFIDQVRDAVPSERETTRMQLQGLQVAFFLSDYVMAAKTNDRLVLSKNAIISSFTNISPDTSIIVGRLANYAQRTGTLSDHYQSVSENSEAKEPIRTIKTKLTENGVVLDTESDLLMDCIRYAYFMTNIREMYGPNPRRLEEVRVSGLSNANQQIPARLR